MIKSLNSSNITVVKNKIDETNWAFTPKYETIANICNHRESCKYAAECGHSRAHHPESNCKESCHGAGKCFDVSAVGVWI